MASSGSDDNEWQPPTEAQMKILAARRERSDKISQLMGQYLLKGYKMLGTNCTACGCILMQDKQKIDYCVACMELDTDTDKDNPAVSRTAARSLEEERRNLMEERRSQIPQLSSSPEPIPTPMDASVESTHTAASDRGTQDNINANFSFNQPFKAASQPPTSRLPKCDGVKLNSGKESSYSPLPNVETAYPLRVLNARLLSATRDLETSVSTETSIQLCMLIKSCAESIAALYKLQSRTESPI